MAEPLGTLLAELSATDHSRANRYRQPADRLRFLYGRVLVGWVGAGLTGYTAQTVPLVIGPYGKPDLAAHTGWHINLTHAGDWVLLAVDRHPVGIDVENRRPDLPIATLLPTVCSPDEQARVWADTDPATAFLRSWTRKEALLKGIGHGLVDDLRVIPSLDGQSSLPPGLSDSDWQVQSFAVDSAHPAALAHQPTDISPVFYRLTASDLLTNLKWA
ncbi:4'-phosphopantetheinyl transferase family protein [Spirosoma rhododendri]|uniref:4'-phosphopantetheinyl transferase superfamily protein n=1 Tax=Spirosoma rhododendri TaxID=2728024 RepID=A0A7L5DLJ3_9BACT|nr:4'-phosphopantetheinyl transferase superfamily protein [Spirosoma rhododendri]QJD79276.1 4'-phosphopantetheinyl transferase superfamily protein [Spirosoma rhododendri]